MSYVLGYGVRSPDVYIPKQSHVLETDGLYTIFIIYPSTIIQRNLVPTFSPFGSFFTSHYFNAV